MINIPPLISRPSFDPSTIPQLIKTWQIGQIINSRAKTSSNAEGELQIQVGQHLLDARSKTPIEAGQELRLQVTQLGEEPVLKITGTNITTDPVKIFLRQAVPQPAKFQLVFNLLNVVKPLLTDDKLLAPIHQQVTKLTGIPINTLNTTGQQIEQFLQHSGFKLEASLKQGQIPASDTKLQLMRLQASLNELLNTITTTSSAIKPEQLTTAYQSLSPAAIAASLLTSLTLTDRSSLLSLLSNPVAMSLDNLPPQLKTLFQNLINMSPARVTETQKWLQLLPALTELRQSIEQSLSTITHNQLQSVQAEADSAFLLLFNLLIAKNPDWIDLFNIKIWRDDESQDQANHWGVTIQFEFSELGLIQARLMLFDNQLHTSLTAESEPSFQVIQDNIYMLESALDKAGFNVATVSCKHEKITRIHHIHHLHGPLLEDKA